MRIRCEKMADAKVTGEESTKGKIINIISKFSKLFFILSCYSFLFFTIIEKSRWFMFGWPPTDDNIDIISWIKSYPNCQTSGLDIVKTIGWNLMLLAVFVCQHSLLAERNLVNTWLHRKLFIEWKINGSLYVLTTAIALKVVVTNWSIVHIYVWKFPSIQRLCNVIHFVVWISLYGSTLMQDMPELIGLHQVVFTNETTSRKSSEFKFMLKKQRHLGLVPFTIVTIVCPMITLDRLLFFFMLLIYSYARWQDPVSFEYIKEMTNRKRSRLSGVGVKID